MDGSDGSAAAGAWREFCAQLADTGDRLLGESFPSDRHARVEGYRHLARLAVMALQSHIEFADPDFPAFHRYDDDAVKWGGPNVDNHYLRARVDPAGTYRIVGNVSDVRDLILSTNEGDMQLGQYGVGDELRLTDLQVDDDGRVDITVGGAPRASNWLPLGSNHRLVMIRVFVADWASDGLAWFDIERLDRVRSAPDHLDEPALAAALTAAGHWVDTTVGYWRDYLETSPVRALVNRLSPPRAAAGGSDRIRYGAGWWALDDEVLLIEFPAPDVDYWSFQLYSTPWFESLDVRNRLNSYNNTNAAIDDDGIVRLAVAATDPGWINWLDTEGRAAGMVSYRFVGGSGEPPHPKATLMPRVSGTPRPAVGDPRARAEQIAARRRGIARRFHR